jgi:hypothetical protein
LKHIPILPPPEPQTMGHSINAPLLSALMRQWGQRVDQALADDLRWTDLAAWAREAFYQSKIDEVSSAYRDNGDY